LGQGGAIAKVEDGFRRMLGSVGALYRADAALLWLLLGIVLCTWLFVFMADLVEGQHTQRLDDQVMRAFRVDGDLGRPVGPEWLPSVMRDVTALGSAPVLGFFVLAVAGALWARNQHHALALLLAATLGGRLLNALLKDVFERPRPELALRLTEVKSTSFPSGHAMDSAVIYLTLAALLARLVKPRALKLYFLGLAVLLTAVVGFSRVYLGVHYPSDVLAGWTAGLAWALLCWTVASYLQKRGTVEPEK
jgi:undecaprenyl-diphosphatase